MWLPGIHTLPDHCHPIATRQFNSQLQKYDSHAVPKPQSAVFASPPEQTIPCCALGYLTRIARLV